MLADMFQRHGGVTAVHCYLLTSDTRKEPNLSKFSDLKGSRLQIEKIFLLNKPFINSIWKMIPTKLNPDLLLFQKSNKYLMSWRFLSEPADVIAEISFRFACVIGKTKSC